MSRQAVIVDTNVVVARLLTGSDASPVARILEGMLAAAVPFVVSEALPAEYPTVLVRPGLHKLHGLTVAEVETLLTDVAQHAIVQPPAAVPPAPHPGDRFLRELLAARADLRLVAGDKALLRDPGLQSRLVSPRSFGGES